MPSKAKDMVSATEKALELIEKLKERHGKLMFHQSGGCCDGSAPMCYELNELVIGDQDVYLGSIGGCPFYIAAFQYEAWSNTRLIIDVVEGRGSGFSLEAPYNLRFITRSKVCH